VCAGRRGDGLGEGGGRGRRLHAMTHHVGHAWRGVHAEVGHHAVEVVRLQRGRQRAQRLPELHGGNGGGSIEGTRDRPTTRAPSADEQTGSPTGPRTQNPACPTTPGRAVQYRTVQCNAIQRSTHLRAAYGVLEEGLGALPVRQVLHQAGAHGGLGQHAAAVGRGRQEGAVRRGVHIHAHAHAAHARTCS
jgi:hypothetical protein